MTLDPTLIVINSLAPFGEHLLKQETTIQLSLTSPLKNHSLVLSLSPNHTIHGPLGTPGSGRILTIYFRCHRHPGFSKVSDIHEDVVS